MIPKWLAGAAPVKPSVKLCKAARVRCRLRELSHKRLNLPFPLDDRDERQ
jgi:hypothetical protein